MKISIWQQFSSNHSADYSIIGEFASAEAAQVAGDKIRQIVVEIAAWSEQYRGNLSAIWGENFGLSPIEQQYAQAYRIDWKEPIDWLRPYPRGFRPPFQREPEQHVLVLDRLVFIEAPGQVTQQTGHQFVNLIAAMNGQAYRSVFMGTDPDDDSDEFRGVEFDLVCITPSVEAGARLHRLLESHIKDRETSWGTWQPIVWVSHHPLYTHYTGNMPIDKFVAAEQIWLWENRVWYEFAQTHEMTHEERLAKWQEVIQQERPLHDGISQLRQDVTLDSGAACQLQATQIELKHVAMQNCFLLPALIGWMQAQGGVVNYQLRQLD